MNAIVPVLDALLSALPLIVAAVVPPALAYFNSKVGAIVPKHLYPVLLPVAGALLAGAAKAAGFDVGDFNSETADLDMWQTMVAGALSGHAAIGIHQIKKQLDKSHDQN